MHAFLSSSGADVARFVHAARSSIESLGFRCLTSNDLAGTNYFEQLDRAIKDASFVVMLIGNQYGERPQGAVLSHAEYAFEALRKFRTPCFSFVFDAPKVPAPDEMQRRFRTHVLRTGLIHQFDSSESLKLRLGAALKEWRGRQSEGSSRLPTKLDGLFASERELIDAICELLIRMPGTEGVRVVHGPNDRGRDILFYSTGPFGDKVLCGCQVKNVQLSASIGKSSSITTVIEQMHAAFDEPFHDPLSGPTRLSRFYLMTPHAIGERALAAIEGRIAARRPQIEILDGPRLYDLFRSYWPEFLEGMVAAHRGDPSAMRRERILVTFVASDKELASELLLHLSPMANSGQIDLEVRQLTRRLEVSEREWVRADLVLLLLSPECIARRDTASLLTQAVANLRSGRPPRVVPIVARECSWERTPAGRLNVLPSDRRALASQRDRDTAWKGVVSNLNSVWEHSSRPDSASERHPVYLRRLHLNNIRSFSDVALDFSDSMFSLVVGNNGLGKSTLLRCLALALCSESGAISLLPTMAGDLIRFECDEGRIVVEVEDRRGRSWTSTTYLRRSKSDSPVESGSAGNRLNRIELSKDSDQDFPFSRLFGCGYGAGRKSAATADPADEYGIETACRTLFDYSAPLQNPELILRRLLDVSGSPSEFMLKLDAMLGLDPGSADLDPSGIRVTGPWGGLVPLGALGDGYQSTVAWLLDLFGQFALFDSSSRRDLAGVVLIDELEQHLHPNWQREIVARLTRQMPNVQFIATSHSPICVGGLADLDESRAPRLQCLSREGTETKVWQMPVPVGMRYDEIVTSLAFGLDIARDTTTARLINELRDALDLPTTDPQRDARVSGALTELRSRSAHAAEDERGNAVDRELLTSMVQLKRLIEEKQ